MYSLGASIVRQQKVRRINHLFKIVQQRVLSSVSAVKQLQRDWLFFALFKHIEKNENV